MNRTTSGIILSEFVLSGDPLYRQKDHIYMSSGLSYRNQVLFYKLFLILLIWRGLIGGQKESKAEETTESGNAQCILTIFMKFEHLYCYTVKKISMESKNLE